MRTNTTLVINPKGGSGKTTITTNLASYFAAKGTAAAIMDYDPQGSSLNWLHLRPGDAAKIHGANAAPAKGLRLRSMDMRVPEDTRQLVIDGFAGASGLVLQEMLDRATCLLVPVPPSPIDIHATANFVSEVLNTVRMQSRRLPVAIVANKVRRSMPQYAPFDWFLSTLKLPLVARLVDSDVYVKAGEAGVGIFEMEPGLVVPERRQFTPIVEWVKSHARGIAPQPEGAVYELARVRLA